jgi:hypothetical protein
LIFDFNGFGAGAIVLWLLVTVTEYLPVFYRFEVVAPVDHKCHNQNRHQLLLYCFANGTTSGIVILGFDKRVSFNSETA